MAVSGMAVHEGTTTLIENEGVTSLPISSPPAHSQRIATPHMLSARTCSCSLAVAFHAGDDFGLTFSRNISFRAQDVWFVAALDTKTRGLRPQAEVDDEFVFTVTKIASPAFIEQHSAAFDEEELWVYYKFIADPRVWTIIGIAKHRFRCAPTRAREDFRLVVQARPLVAGRLAVPELQLSFLDRSEGQHMPVVVHGGSLMVEVAEAGPSAIQREND